MRGVDSETALIQPGLLAPPLACVTWCEDPQDEGEIIHGNDTATPRLIESFLQEEQTIANAPYDLAVFVAHSPDILPLVFEALEQNRIHDPCMRQKLMDIGEGCYRFQEVDEGLEEPVYRAVGYSLSDLNNRYFGSHLEKDEWRLQYGKLRHLPLSQWPAGAVKYAKLDANVHLKVHVKQQEQKLRAPIELYLENETFQNRAAWVLHLISCWGIRTDEKEVAKFLQKVEAEQHIRRESLQREGLVKDDESRTQKAAVARMREVMGDRCELTPKGLEQYRAWWAQMHKLKKLTEEGKILEKRRLFEHGYVSLKADICLRSGDKTLLEYARYGQHKTLYTKVSKLRTNGYPIQTSFEPLLETGRTSSFASKIIPNSVAVQNLPRKEGMRECFVPRNWDSTDILLRNVFVACDYGMAELVSLAQVCFKLFGYSKLRDALNAGMDPHLDFAADLLEISYAEAVRRLDEDDPILKEYRQMSKAFNFGSPGGLGAEKFVDYARMGYGVKFSKETDPTKNQEESIEKVREYKRKWLKKWPEMHDYFNFFGNLAAQDPEGLIDIKQAFTNRLRGRLQYTVACNTMFQGLTADGAKAALYQCVKRCYVKFPNSVMFGSRIVNFVHDENVGECLESIAHEFAMEMKGVMEVEYQKYTPDVRIGVEPVIMRRWRKGAKPVWLNTQTLTLHKHMPDENGRLIPFEDKHLYQKKAA